MAMYCCGPSELTRTIAQPDKRQTTSRANVKQRDFHGERQRVTMHAPMRGDRMSSVRRRFSSRERFGTRIAGHKTDTAVELSYGVIFWRARIKSGAAAALSTGRRPHIR
jgi:hypothetical protein